MVRISAGYGRFLDGLMLIVCFGLAMMVILICADVFFRNLGTSGIDFGNEVSEYILYLSTLLSAPWILRKGQHVRVDILLRLFPGWLGRGLEWASDIAGFCCCLLFVWYGTVATISSARSAAISIKTLVLPDWWILAPLPAAFAVLAVEFLFRMHRLANMETSIRDDAVSAA